MRGGANASVRAAVWLYTPLIALFAFSLLPARPAGGGVGFVVGLALALVLILHALMFGAAAARRALPGPIARAMLALGLIAAVVGVGAPGLAYAPRVIEAGLMLTTLGAAALALAVLAGRAPTMREEDW